MSKRTYIWTVAAAIAVAVAVALFPKGRNDPPLPAAARDEAPAALHTPDPPDDAAGRASARLPTPAPIADTASDPDIPVSQSNDRTFRVNASGQLILDEHTRLNMEALFARTDRDRLAEAKQQAIDPLPAGPAAQAAELLEQYDNYQQAQKQAYPPGVAPPTAEAALAELDGLHALREAHFGPVVARALYGAEEKLSRELIEQMRQEKDRSP